MDFSKYYFRMNKGGTCMCIPNSTTEVWKVFDVDVLDNIVEPQLAQHVLSSGLDRQIFGFFTSSLRGLGAQRLVSGFRGQGFGNECRG